MPTTTSMPSTRSAIPARAARRGRTVPRATAGAGMVRWSLPRRLRQAVLAVHIISAGTWIGIDVLVAVLVGAGRLATDPATRGLAYRALGTFVATPMLVTALVCLCSGLVLGWSSRWGVLRYWWVLVKLVVTIVLALLIIGVLAPGMPDVVVAGRSVGSGAPAPASLDTLVYPPAVSLTTLGVATVLSVYKPWGKLRAARDRRRQRRARRVSWSRQREQDRPHR